MFTIKDYLHHKGIELDQRDMCMSPYRDDSTPSFKYYESSQSWCDFGDDRKGGNLVELVKLTELVDTKRAYEIIKELNGGGSGNTVSRIDFSKRTEKKSSTDYSKREVFDVKPLFSYALKEYVVKERGIKEGVFPFIQECKYNYLNKNGEQKVGFAVCWKNEEGGYSGRSKHFKGMLAGKSGISIFNKGHLNILAFEGFFDYLAHLSLAGYDHKSTYIILNSTAGAKHLVKWIKENYNNLDEVVLFTRFDNGEGGDKATRIVERSLCRAIVIDKRYEFAEYEDLGDKVKGILSKEKKKRVYTTEKSQFTIEYTNGKPKYTLKNYLTESVKELATFDFREYLRLSRIIGVYPRYNGVSDTPPKISQEMILNLIKEKGIDKDTLIQAIRQMLDDKVDKTMKTKTKAIANVTYTILDGNRADIEETLNSL